MVDLGALRQRIRARRRNITGHERQHLSLASTATFIDWLQSKHGITRIATFLSLPEEIDTAPLNHHLWQAGYQLYLPYVNAIDQPLLWLPYRADTPLYPDNANIPAPEKNLSEALHGLELHAVITPLVAWDSHGTRLGMGGGFYDRTFQSKMPHVMPWLIGFAYPCQHVPQLPRHDWDIPLDAVACAHNLYTQNQEHI